MKRMVLMMAWASLLGGSGCFYVRELTKEVVEPTRESVMRGSNLVNHIAACGACHNSRKDGSLMEDEIEGGFLAGGNVIRDASDGSEVYVPNITPDKETGIGNMTDDQLMRAIRDGIGADGRFLHPHHPAMAYGKISEKDIRSIVAFLKDVEPKRQEKPRQKNKVPWTMQMSISLGWMRHLPAKAVSEPDKADLVKYGEYVAHLGNCAGCHSRKKSGSVMGPKDVGFMGGSETPFADPRVGKVWARNLTPDLATGLGKYDNEKIEWALRHHKRLDGKKMAPPMSYFVHQFDEMGVDEMDALIAYLKSLKPVKHKVPPRELTPEAEKLFGGGD